MVLDLKSKFRYLIIRKEASNMPRLTHMQRHDWEMYINPRTGRRAYNDLCRRCTHQCRQSYRATILECRRFRSKRSGNPNT